MSRLAIASTFLLASVATTLAQSLDELPNDVASVAREYVALCSAAGGRPDYNPLDFVKLVFFNASWDRGGLESYIVDTNALTCQGVGTRPGCDKDGCTLAVLNPRGPNRFVVDFEGPVRVWRLLGNNAAAGGPDVKIEITGGVGTRMTYSVTANGMYQQ